MRTLLKYGIVIVWIAILLTPPTIFIQNNGWPNWSEPITFFPLFGLMAFTLVWSQIMLGSFMRYWEKLYPRILPLHIVQGLFTLGFAGTHWLLLFSTFLPNRVAEYLGYTYVSPELKIYAILGQIALLLLGLGVVAGLLRDWPPIKRYWHWLHLVHYLVFFIIFIHSRNLGSDLHSTPALQYLWYFFFVTVAGGIIYRRFYVPSKDGLIRSTS
jgi:hypothetical protein